jgi:hypothetical protein
MPISGLTDMNFPICLLSHQKISSFSTSRRKANETSLAKKCQISVTFNNFPGKESRNSQSLLVPASLAAHILKPKSQTYPV